MFRNRINSKWYVMTLQGEGLRSVLHKDGMVSSSLTSLNSCQIDVKIGERIGVRVKVSDKHITTMVEDGLEFKQC